MPRKRLVKKLLRKLKPKNSRLDDLLDAANRAPRDRRARTLKKLRKKARSAPKKIAVAGGVGVGAGYYAGKKRKSKKRRK